MLFFVVVFVRACFRVYCVHILFTSGSTEDSPWASYTLAVAKNSWHFSGVVLAYYLIRFLFLQSHFPLMPDAHYLKKNHLFFPHFYLIPVEDCMWSTFVNPAQKQKPIIEHFKSISLN